MIIGFFDNNNGIFIIIGLSTSNFFNIFVIKLYIHP